MIKKISKITNMGVFQDFDWNQTLRDRGNNVAQFLETNIIYGRNYSGKTTLSRVLRSLENKSLPDKYESPEFIVEGLDGKTYSEQDLSSFNAPVRVFNEDFVKENLQFISNPDGGIRSFAIVGNDNVKIERKISELNAVLGEREKNTGLYKVLSDTLAEKIKANEEYSLAKSVLRKKLKDKAKIIKKNTSTYNDTDYDIRDINKDIEAVSKDTYESLSEVEAERLRQTLKENAKTDIPPFVKPTFKISSLCKGAAGLLEKQIRPTESIQDLLDNELLSEWVKKGKEHHSEDDETCKFCGAKISGDLWGRLDRHFNKESENLINSLDELLLEVQSEKANKVDPLKLDKELFYVKYSSEVDDLIASSVAVNENYIRDLEAIESALESRKNSIFKSITTLDILSNDNVFDQVFEKAEELRQNSNKHTGKLEALKAEASESLRHEEVYSFLRDIQYHDTVASIEQLKRGAEEVERSYTKIGDTVRDTENEIKDLRSKLQDEEAGARRVNHFLNSYFGSDHICLEAIREDESNEVCGEKSFRFEVIRNGNKAYNLSEGECSLIAFCYFMAKLEDNETLGNKPIIWIDDPISSLDSNHIFFIFSMINGEIVEKKIHDQIFISTHNLDFLKYLKKVSKDYSGSKSNKKKIREFFIVERTGEHSSIKLMPQYLKSYVTEFNYLFSKIYQCANPQSENGITYDDAYCFPNNARKFLEAFLFYKYPNADESDKGKLKRFFGDDKIATALVERITNEYSHLEGAVERSVKPMDIPEAERLALYILEKINEHDSDQFNALVESVKRN